MVVLEKILTAEQVGRRVNSAVAESNLFEMECVHVGNLVGCLRLMLHDLVGCISTASLPLYDRPIVRIVTEVSKNLERALTLVRKCKRCTLFRRFVTGKHATDFPRIFALLESSIADMNWLLNLFNPNLGYASKEPDLSVPPIAIKDPVISWVWVFIATVEMSLLKNRIEAADNLAKKRFNF
ncbi:hypothetical protein SLEP1_g25880 [Rubroshorea leprosula]|uniref:DUF7792 domain-containing protein n=1 Tax=Rubroshorea leprosula TaxID=152421 RepID=A0AAV5JUX4_9ROSI|nr:hypothetical protein SLEP1_g25880 [Rubroshorea leprosula]